MDEEKELELIFENKELRDLNTMFTNFMVVVRSRLIAKFVDGKRGYMWQDSGRRDTMMVQLLANAADGDMVDSVAFAAFIWNLDKE